jgi:SPP1 family predicted phage head-tail adaptor
MSGLLNNTCSTTRPTTGKNSFGGNGRTFAANLTGVRCRKQQKSDKELNSISDGGRGEVATHKLWVDYGTDIEAKDRATVDGVTFEVIGVDADMGSRGLYMSLDLLEVRT